MIILCRSWIQGADAQQVYLQQTAPAIMALNVKILLWAAACRWQKQLQGCNSPGRILQDCFTNPRKTSSLAVLKSQFQQAPALWDLTQGQPALISKALSHPVATHVLIGLVPPEHEDGCISGAPMPISTWQQQVLQSCRAGRNSDNDSVQKALLAL